MTTLHDVARRLADILEMENVALRRLDLPGATRLLGAKRAALAAFEECCRDSRAQLPLGDSPPDDSPLDDSMAPIAARLRDVAAENKSLLERAIRAQQHIIGLLAQAARKAAQPSHYGARGAYADRQGGRAFALSARI